MLGTAAVLRFAAVYPEALLLVALSRR